MIKCIANSNTDNGPEVPLWECACPACTLMEWECECEYEHTRTLKAHRHEKWPEFWDSRGKEI
jgi:hypothetical protein